MKKYILVLFLLFDIVKLSYAQSAIEIGDSLEAVADANAQKSYARGKAYMGYLSSYRTYASIGANLNSRQIQILNKTYNLLQKEILLSKSVQLVIDSLIREAEVNFGNDHKNYLPLLESFICKSNSTLDRYKRAFELYDKAIKLRAKYNILKGEEYEKLLRWYTSHLSFRKDITKEQIYEIYSQLWLIFNENHKDSIDIKLVDNYYIACGFQKGRHEEIKVKLSEIKKQHIIKYKGKNSDDYLKILKQLAYCYDDKAVKNEKDKINDDARSKSIQYQYEYWEILNHKDEIYDKNASSFFSTLQYDILTYTKDTLLAQTLTKDYVEKIEKKFGKQTEWYIESLGLLSRTYQNDDISLIPLLKEKLKLEKNVYGEENAHTKATYSFLQLVYLQTHKMGAAIELDESNEDSTTSSLSNEDCMSMLNKASLLAQYGKLREANQLYDKLLAVSISNTFVKSTTFLASVLGSLNNLLSFKDISGMLDFANKWCYNSLLTLEDRNLIFTAVIGMASMAGNANHEVLQFVNKYTEANIQLTPNENFQVLAMEAKACVFFGMQRFDAAIAVLDDILGLLKVQNNIKLNIKYSIYKEICYMAKGNFLYALSLNKNNLEMIKNSPGYDTTAEFYSASCRACLYYDQLGQYDSIAPLVKKIENIQFKDLKEINKFSPFEINCYTPSSIWLDFSSIITPYIHNCLYLGEYQKASVVIRKHIEDLYETMYFSLTQPDPAITMGKYGYMKIASDNLNLVGSYNSKDKNLAKLVFDYSLLYKQSFLTAENLLKQQILNSSDTTLVDKFKELQRLHNVIQQNKRFAVDNKNLYEQAIQIDRQIRQDVKFYGTYIDDLKLKWKDIQNNMKDNEGVIEFFSYEDYKNKKQNIGGAILKKDWDAPMILSLCQENELGNGDQFNNEAITKLVWIPILDAIGDVRKIYFSPAGIIYNLPIESAKLNGKYLSESYELLRISSSRILCKRDYQIGNEAFIIGGIQYNLTEKELKNNNNRSQDRNLNTSKGELNRAAIHQLSYLSGTKVEAESIYKIITSQNKMKAHLYMGKEAVENTIKGIKTKSTRILHIATHGFFDPIEKARSASIENGLSFNEDNILSRSGLFMAGAQNSLDGDNIPSNFDDGILTAQEISNIDLRGIDLVVLSACETAKGDISGDGVFGLQRGFKKAGVNSVLMSLWKVDDAATSRFMTEFYTNWLVKKMTKNKSLEVAKQVVRQIPEWGSPKYWSAFILLDGLD